MTITIIPIEDHESYRVNEHIVYKSENQWTSKTELSEMERRAFRRYQTQVIDNPAFKRHTKSVFKTK